MTKVDYLLIITIAVTAVLAGIKIQLVYSSNNTTNSTNSTSVEQLQLNQEDLGNTITSKGCGEGYGYYVNDPTPFCEPIDRIGQGPLKDGAFCAAIGCPYNPPAATELPGKGGGSACAALYTYNPETGQCELPPGKPVPVMPTECPEGTAIVDDSGECKEVPKEVTPLPRPVVDSEPEPEPIPEPDPGNGDQNDGSDSEEGGGNGDSGSDGEGGDSSDGGGSEEE